MKTSIFQNPLVGISDIKVNCQPLNKAIVMVSYENTTYDMTDTATVTIKLDFLDQDLKFRPEL